MLALHTGMRKSEILNLTWDSINIINGYIELVDQKNGERSTIPLNRIAIETIQSIPRRIDSKYVFPGKTPNKPFYDLKWQFEKSVSSAKLDGVTFHVLRHYLPFPTMSSDIGSQRRSIRNHRVRARTRSPTHPT